MGHHIVDRFRALSFTISPPVYTVFLIQLLAAGVNVALSQDDVDDAYYPHGSSNLLEVAFLASHMLWMMSQQDRETIYDMITGNAAKILRIED
jgi:cytosine deaminase